MSNPYLTDSEVRRLRTANIPVPESLKELKRFLDESESSPLEIPMDDAFRKIRVRLKKKFGAVQNA